jgi:hypothetical protein
MPIPPIREAGDSEHIQDHNDISTELAARLPLSGGTLTGALNGTSATFTGVVNSSGATLTGALNGTSGTFSSTVTAATPTANGHLATKLYVDNKVASASSGIFAQATIRATWTGNLPPYQDGATGTVMTVTLPSGRFTQPPIVSCQEMNITHAGVSGDNYFDVLPYSVSTSSIGLWVQNNGPRIAVSGGRNITGGVVDVWAVQMTSGSSLG